MSGASAAGYLGLATRTAGALGRIATDRVDEAFGRALPRTPEQLARPGVLNRLLASAGLPPVRAARLPGVTFDSSNCRNFLIEVEFEAHEGRAEDAPLPRGLYAKMPCEELATRAFAGAVGFWEVEAAFCARVAAQAPVRVPRVYAVARRGARFVLLLENLHELPGTRLFLNRDMAAGTTPERSRMCLSTFAELHAAFWGWSAERRESLLPSRLHPYLGPGGRTVTRALNAAALAPAHAAAPEIFTREHLAIARLAIEKWDALVDAWYREPLTLIHGDSHLANTFEYPAEEGPRMGLIDFQGMQWCPGVRDIQYHLINSLEPEVLAECESELLEGYRAELGERGVELDAEDARAQYRAFSFQTLIVPVVSLGLGSMTEREETVRTLLRRSVAAVDRLGFGDWLAAL